jgi:hypothetical protein
MKRTLEIRDINILNKAMQAGFEGNFNATIEENLSDAQDYLIEWEVGLYEAQAQVTSVGRGEETFSWADKKGFEIIGNGQILGEGLEKHGDNVYHTTTVDTDGNVVKLYHVL